MPMPIIAMSPQAATMDQPRKRAWAGEHKRYGLSSRCGIGTGIYVTRRNSDTRYPASHKSACDLQAWGLRRFRSSTTATILEAFFLDAAPAPDDRLADVGEGLFNEFTHRMGLAGREHIIVRLGLLQHHPHPLHIIARMAPVAHSIEIARKSFCCSPCSIDATARVILRVTNVSPRIGLS